MKIVIAGGSGQVGRLLARHFDAESHAVTILSRHSGAARWRAVLWDGVSAGDWVNELKGSDMCINLAGRSVNCRYTVGNRAAILSSRINSTRLLGDVISRMHSPPRLWINASTATLYRHSLDRAMDEDTGEPGGSEPNAPAAWRFSVEVAKAWEQAFFSRPTPLTRKVAIRSAMTFSPDPGGVFDVLLNLVRRGLGGTQGSGRQYVSWIHEFDFIRAIEWIIAHETVDGAVNVASPHPVRNREFMRILRQASGVRAGLPAPAWLLEVGAVFLRTESELVLKSRCVVPGRLLASGLEFQFPEWQGAAEDLVRRWRSARH